MFGEYELKSKEGIWEKPHYVSIFKSGKYGIWYDEDGRLTIGLSIKIGTKDALAYVEPKDLDVNDCPYDPAYVWFSKKRKTFIEADEGLTIECVGC